MAAQGYPGWEKPDVEAGYGGGMPAAAPPPGAYGAPPPPAMGYGAAAAGGGYAAAAVHAAPPPPPPPEPSNLVAQASQLARAGFIRKVYSLLTLQLLLTFGVITIFSFVDPVRFYVLDYQGGRNWFMITFMVLALATLFSLACCGNTARKYPMNLILLFTFTAFESLFLGGLAAMYSCNADFNDLYSSECTRANGYVSCKYILQEQNCNDPDKALPGSAVVMVAVGCTAFVVFSLTLFAFQTRWDFTGFAPYAFAGVAVLFAFIIVGSIFFRGNWTFNLIYAIIGVLVFSFYLVFDTQLIVGGKARQFQYGLDDYIIAALNLYVDIINLFLYILSIVGLANQ